MKPSRLAVDTNVLIDLAGQVQDVLDAIDIIDDRLPDTEWLVTLGVLDELAYIADFGLSQSASQSARQAIQLLRRKDRFRPILELPFGPEKVEELGGEFLRCALLPVSEVHDALILAEAALLGCHVLLTSDEHLRSLDYQQLAWQLHQHSLTAPVIATPREIVRKFFR